MLSVYLQPAQQKAWWTDGSLDWLGWKRPAAAVS